MFKINNNIQSKFENLSKDADKIKKTHINLIPDQCNLSTKVPTDKGCLGCLEKLGCYLSIKNARFEGGKIRFNSDETKKILSKITPANKEFLTTLFNAKDATQSLRFSAKEISSILFKINGKNRNAVDMLVNSKTIVDGKKLDIPSISTNDILSILPNVNDKNINTLKYLTEAENANKSQRFLGHDIANIMNVCNSEHNLKSLVSAVDSSFKPKYSVENIVIIMPKLTKERSVSVFNELVKNPAITGKSVASIMQLADYNIPIKKIIDNDLKSFTDVEKKNYKIFLDNIEQESTTFVHYGADNRDLMAALSGLDNKDFPLIPKTFDEVKAVKEKLGLSKV